MSTELMSPADRASRQNDSIDAGQPPVDLSVILPTYCEAENLAILVPQIAQVLRQAKLRGEILVVDDDSPDATSRVCETLAESYPVRLLTRKGQRGISGAILHGMQQAQGEILVVLDADLQHPPERIPDLFRVIQQDEADLAIGSRFIPQGSTDEAWGLRRWLLSQVGRLLVRPLTTARDPGAGFFALRRAKVAGVSEIDPTVYKMALELLVKCSCHRVQEIPIHFRSRQHGESKLTFREQLKYLQHVARLYRYKLRQWLRGPTG